MSAPILTADERAEAERFIHALQGTGLETGITQKLARALATIAALEQDKARLEEEVRSLRPGIWLPPGATTTATPRPDTTAASRDGGSRAREPRLTRNAAKCRKCGDVIESTHRHHAQRCSCGAIFVDGGLDYRRYGGDIDALEDLCEYEQEAPR